MKPGAQANADMARLHLMKAVDKASGFASGAYVVANTMLGKLLVSRGMHREAAEHFEAAAKGAPLACAQHVKLQLAWSLWHCRRNDDAAATYWAVLDDDVLCWQALIDRARMNLGAGLWTQALCDLAQVAAMGKADADVCNDLGVSHFESAKAKDTKDYERALHFFTEAIAKNPAHAPAISNRANCLKAQGRLREAEEDYTRAIDIDDSNPKAYMNRGALLRDQGKTTRAHRDFERALALDPTNALLQQEVRALAEKLDAMGPAGGAHRDHRQSSVPGGGKGAAAAAAAAGGAGRRWRRSPRSRRHAQSGAPPPRAATQDRAEGGARRGVCFYFSRAWMIGDVLDHTTRANG